MPSLSLSVLAAVVATLLQSLVDGKKLSGWEGAAAEGSLALLKRFAPGGGPVATLNQHHVSGSMAMVPEHDPLLESFPADEVTPESVKTWGEALVKAKAEAEGESKGKAHAPAHAHAK